MSVEFAALSYESALAAIGEPFSVSLTEDGEAIVDMRLSEVEPIGNPHALCARPFSLIFEAPASTPFKQGTYFFKHPNLATHPIFIVPVAQTAETRKYQAIFN